MARVRRIFITGGAGCVGHYVVERLLADPGNQLVLLLRQGSRLREDLRARVEVLEGDLARPATFLDRLGHVDDAVLLAASWGGEDSPQVNVHTTHAILDALDPETCRKVLYFSTASLLGPDGQLLGAAQAHGTGYIRHKLEALQGIAATRMASRVVPVFPTVIMGGDATHPYSHASGGLPDLMRFLPLLRRLTLDGSFHMIHAADIARAVAWLLAHDPPSQPVVLGIPALTPGEVLSGLGEFFGKAPAAQFDITRLALALPRLVPGKFTPWDRYCLENRHFRYQVLDLTKVMEPSGLETLAGILAADPRLMAMKGIQ